MKFLGAERAYIFRITHLRNLEWLLDHGIHCRNSSDFQAGFVNIGNSELIAKRSKREVQVPPGGTLSDYVPFYFTPRTPMLYNICSGHGGARVQPPEDIVILVSTLQRLKVLDITFLFTDRHAYLKSARFSRDLSDLSWIDWESLQNSDFKRDIEDPGRIERYQAEALVHRHLPAEALLGIACYDSPTTALIEQWLKDRNIRLKVEARPRWYPS